LTENNYLELMMKSMSARDKVKGFVLDLIRDGVIPEIYETGFLGITINVKNKFLEFLAQATDEKLEIAAKDGHKRFA
jgi:hypothetical protein